MSQENYISRCFDDYSSELSDQDFDFDFENTLKNHNNQKSKAKTLEERVKIRKSIEEIIEQRRLKEETDFI